MKNFTIEYDITMTGTLYVEANTEEEAKSMALENISIAPYYYAKHSTHHLKTEIVDIYE